MGGAIRVLMIEDAEVDALLNVRELERGGYEPHWQRVETAEEMAAALRDREWDVILADYRLPRFSAPAALELLQGTELDLPFIVVSGGIGEETAVMAMKAGAHDFFLKSNMARLVAVHEQQLDMHTAWRQDVFVPLGQGCVDFPALTERLHLAGYHGWIIVEQDVVPDDEGGMTPDPLECARASREYLRGLGL